MGSLDDNEFNYKYRHQRKNYKYVDIYSTERKKERIKNRKIPIFKIFSFVFFLILGIIGGVMIYAYNTLKSFNYEEIQPDNSSSFSEKDEEGLLNDKMVLNILVIGNDSMSAGDQGRSDSMMIMSLNVRDQKIKLTSIMRDIWINIPKYGKDRINASYAFGGPTLTIETIQKNFGVLIDRFICVDFEGFSKIVDSLGGIDIELTAAECAYINKYSGDKNTLKGAGIKHLTGLQALHHSRNRNSKGSDYDRTSRQRDVVRSIVKALKASNVAKITEMVTALAPMITTNFKTSEITRLVTNSGTYLNYSVEEFRLPTDDNVVDETHDQKMVLEIKNLEKAKKDIKKFIYGSEYQTQQN